MEVITSPAARSSGATTAAVGWYLSGRLEPGLPVSKYAVSGDCFTVGRREGLNLTLPSMRVSGRHAELLVVGGHLFIRDLGSTNGTFVNHKQLTRPRQIKEGDHIEFADVEFLVGFQRDDSGVNINPDLKKTMRSVSTFEPNWVFSQFDRLIRDRGVVPHYQPIIRLQDFQICGYEALARSDIPGLETPGAMFETAELVRREVELSIVCRERAIEVARGLDRRLRLFVNTHPRESLDEDVLPSLRKLRQGAPDVQIVLEIHEGTVNDPARMRDFAAELKTLRVQLAYDDFGSGRSRLLELVQSPPDFLKFDIALIRGIDQAPTHHHRMLRMLIQMARDFTAATLAEGIETAAEAEVCRELGFDYAQGYLYGRPLPIEQVQQRRSSKSMPVVAVK
jgi:EAL domain-containing protein (putative c-di-GMP-specific phosphodiesterase class I)